MDMNKDAITIGLNRCSWLFAVIVGIVTMVTLVSNKGWDSPGDYMPATLLVAILLGFLGLMVFRMGV
jgi:hypothetical protein